VPTSATVAAACAASLAAGFEVEFADADGTRRCELLGSCWDARFEDVVPVRPFRWSAGQRHFSGWWWSAKTGRHVGHESWLERDHAMMLDFDPAVAGFSSQPFWLSWREEGKTRRHAPDYFARMADGTAAVIDVRADDQVPARDAEVFEVTAWACASVGWSYRRAGAVDPVLAANVRWLAACEQGRRVRYITCAQLVNELVEAADDRQLTRVVGRYARLDLLLPGELGYVQIDPRGAELLFQIITEREERASIGIGTNLPFSKAHMFEATCVRQ
jgi:hypothetical protein